MTAALAAIAVVVIAHRLRPKPARPAADAGDRSSRGDGRITRWATALVAVVRRRRAERAGLAPSTVAEWCSDLARSIRSGDALRSALLHTVPANGQLRTATGPIRLGLSRGRSIVEVAEPETGTRATIADGRADHLGLAFAVVAVCGRMGGSAAAPLDRVAAALRQRAADEQERAAQAAQARLSAHVLTLVPVFVLGLLVIADTDVRATLTAPAGAAVVAGGVTLNVVGWFWMRRIVRGAE